MVVLAVSIASAADPPEYELNRTFGPDGLESSGFSAAGPIAVDQQTGAVYVIDREEGSLFKFDLDGFAEAFGGAAPYISGNEITGLTWFPGAGESQVAVDSVSHKIFVTDDNTVRAFDSQGEAAEFTAGPGEGTSEIGGFTRLNGIAIDSNGYIYASDRSEEIVKIFAPSGTEVTQLEAPGAANLAVNSQGVLYVNRQLGTVLKFTPSSFPVTGGTTYSAASEPLSPAQSYTVSIDPVTDEVYVAEILFDPPKIAVYDAADNLITTFAGPGEEGEIRISEGVAVHSESKRVFVADQPLSGLSQVKIFDVRVFLPESPTVTSLNVSDVTADSALLHAEINPNSVDTTYRFEYGPEDCSASTCSSIPIDEPSIGSDHLDVSVTQAISGLKPETTYHYRIVAKNKLGSDMQSRTFTTQGPALGFLLSDLRAWEMVSPSNKRGALLVGGLQAAADGSGITYLSAGSIDPDPDGSRARESATVLARRIGGVWNSKDITPANTLVVPLAVGSETEYTYFSSDLSRAVLVPRDGSQLSLEASERTPYLRENSEPPLYIPMVTGKEGFANVPSGTVFGGDPLSAIGPIAPVGANPDLSHIVLASLVPLAVGAPGGLQPALYLWTAGQLKPVSVLPLAEGAEGGKIVPAELVGSGKGSTHHAVSNDGSRIFWGRGSYKASGNTLSALYMHDTLTGESVRLDVAEVGASEAGAASPVFQGASPDGTVVFFTDSQQLTKNASSGGADLYRCEIPQEAPLSGCSSLTNVTAAAVMPGESAEVQGLVSGMSEDGGRIYFVAEGILDDESNEFGSSASVGEPNLYLWQESVGVRFVATLSANDSQDWGLKKGAVVAETATLSSNSSPSGRFLSFMSELSLTGEDNLDTATGEPVEQVFRYDANSGDLECISCPRSGASPQGQIAISRPLVDPTSQWSGRRVAATLPDPMVTETAGVAHYRSRSVLNNGRVFFNAYGGLVPADANGDWDVYQYEPVGTGDCDSSPGGATTAVIAGSCVSLISSGTAPEESAFVDASRSGDDAFFLTTAKLSVIDKDDELDLYDARVNGTQAVLSPQVECSGGACQSAGASPNDLTPSSSTFKGPGNIKGKKCPRSKRKIHRAGKTRCVLRKHRKHKQHQRRISKSGRRIR